MDKPNILLITTDQQRFDTIHALGNKYIFTPHLNWLVDQGITFTRCYSDSPICMAARTTIMTGMHGYSTGLTGNSEVIRPMQDLQTLPSLLTKGGYQTRAQGKMHFSPMRANYGFEYMELPMDYYRERNRNAQLGLPKDHGLGENEIEPVISTVNESDSLTHWTVKRSIDFLETRDETRPFFLWTSFTKPHPPFDPCANYWALYSNREVPPPIYGDWSKVLEDMPQGYLKPTYCLNNAYRMSIEQLKDVKRAYYACITQIDYSLGLLFARMRELNLHKNTWIIFTTDHGDMMGDHHLSAKSVFLEGSAHIPLIICPPHRLKGNDPKEGKKCDALVDLADILPTLLKIAGFETPKGIDGRDLMSLVDKPEENHTFYGSCGENYAIIDGDYKYMWVECGGDELLFNISKDPNEQINLISKQEEQDCLINMRKKLVEHMKKYKPALVNNDELVHKAAIRGQQDVFKWPGTHSTVVPTDVLH